MQIKEKILHFIPLHRKFVTFSKLGNYGRFGNQLFQYAAVRAYSIINNLPLILPSADNHELSELRIEVEYVSINNLEKVKKHYYKEEYFHFNPDFFNYHNRIDFLGFFQSYKYFSDFREILLNELKIKDQDIINYCINFIEKIKSSHPGKSLVALHNRRGDNIPSVTTFSDKKKGVFRPDKENFHPLLSMEFINESRSFFPDAVFLIFSDNQDDINWCKKNITGPNHYYSENHGKLIDFTLMQKCDNNIISNSSFSWWAAWLNINPDKTVIAPKKWFGKEYSHYNMDDFFPLDWTVI